jgi:hypothetical protein
VVFAVLVVVAAVLVNNYDYLPPADELKAFFTDDSTTLQVAGYLGALSALFLIWFAGSVRSSLRPAEGGTGRLSAVAFGGGAVAGGLVALAYSILITGAARGGADGGIGSDAAATIYDGYSTIFSVAVPMALGVLIGAAAIVALRTKVWPAWLAWVSAFVAIGSISPVSWIFIGMDVLWILVVAIWLFVKQPATTEA